MTRALVGFALLFCGAVLGSIGLYAPMAELQPTPLGGTETIRMLLELAGIAAIATGTIAALARESVR